MTSSAARGSNRTATAGCCSETPSRARGERQLQHRLESDALVADGFAGGLRRPADVFKRLDDGTCREGRALVRYEQRRGAAQDDAHVGSLRPCPGPRGPPGIGRVLQQLDEEPPVVLAAEDSFRASEGARLLDLLCGQSGRALDNTLLDQSAR